MNIEQLAAQMRRAASQLPTPRLIEAVRHLGGAALPQAETMTRAALLSVYQLREGDDAVDALMDEIGI